MAREIWIDPGWMYHTAEGLETKLVSGGVLIVHAHGGLPLLDICCIALSASSHSWRAVGLNAWRKTAVDARESLDDGHAAVCGLEMSIDVVVTEFTFERCQDMV